MMVGRCGVLCGAIVAVALMASGSKASPVLDDLSDYAFVASRNASHIAVISVAGEEVIARIELGDIPSRIVVSEEERQLIATHADERRMTIVDLDRGEAVRTIDLGFRPDFLKLDDDLGMVALGQHGGDRVALVSLEDGDIYASIDGLQPLSDLMFGPEGKRIFIAERDAGKVHVADVEQGAVVDRIVLENADDGVENLIRTPGGKTGMALHGESGLLSALSLEDGVQVGRSTLPAEVSEGFPSANSQYFLMPNGDADTMSMVSSWTYRESMQLPALPGSKAVNFALFDTVAFSFSGPDQAAMAVSLIDDDPPIPITINLPGAPETALTVDAGKKIFVALSDTDQVAVIDAGTRKLTGLIDDVGDEPWAITAAGGLGYCH